MNELLTLFMAACFGVTGWHCLKRPESIQQWVVQLQQKNRQVAEMNPLRNWVEKAGFVVALRFLGLLCLLNMFMLIYALIVAGSVNSDAGL